MQEQNELDDQQLQEHQELNNVLEQDQIDEPHNQKALNDVDNHQDLDLQPATPVNLPRQKFPTKSKYIKFKRQIGCLIEQYFYIPNHRYLYAQFTHKFKPDKFGCVY